MAPTMCSQAPATVLPTALSAGVQTPIATITLPPTQTDSPTVTLASTVTALATDSPPIPKPIALPAGKSAFEHPETGYVFIADESVWERDSSPERPYALLTHQAMPDCRIDLVPPMGPPQPEAFYQVVIGRFRWSVRQYEKTAIYATSQPAYLYLFLDGNQVPACRAAQEQVLKDLLYGDEYYGGATFRLAPTRIPSILSGFNCPEALPPRLRIQDAAYVIADTLFLRHAPDLKAESKYRNFQKHAPAWIAIVEGPVCVEDKYVFWQVSVSPMSEGTIEWVGWMAESSPEEYYLERIIP